MTVPYCDRRPAGAAGRHHRRAGMTFAKTTVVKDSVYDIGIQWQSMPCWPPGQGPGRTGPWPTGPAGGRQGTCSEYRPIAAASLDPSPRPPASLSLALTDTVTADPPRRWSDSKYWYLNLNDSEDDHWYDRKTGHQTAAWQQLTPRNRATRVQRLSPSANPGLHI